jgi:hypothetical protein
MISGKFYQKQTYDNLKVTDLFKLKISGLKEPHK